MNLDSGILTFSVFWGISGIVWLSSLEFRLKQQRHDIDLALARDSSIEKILNEIRERLIRVETLIEKR